MKTNNYLAGLLLITISFFLCEGGCGMNDSNSTDISSLAVTPAGLVVALKDSSQQYTAKVTYENGDTENVSDDCSWSSSNSSVATISSTGLATFKGIGSTTIKAEYKEKSDSTKLTVNEENYNSIDITPDSYTFYINETYTLTAYGIYSNGTQVDISKNCTWTSVDTNIVEVDNSENKGKISAEAVGETQILATYNGLSDSSDITVK